MSLVSLRPVWAILAISFAALNVWVILVAGVDGIGAYLMALGPVGLLASADLVLALLVGLAFIARDARERGGDARPFVVLTLLTGSLGLLAYLAQRREADSGSRLGRRSALLEGRELS